MPNGSVSNVLAGSALKRVLSLSVSGAPGYTRATMSLKAATTPLFATADGVVEFKGFGKGRKKVNIAVAA